MTTDYNLDLTRPFKLESDATVTIDALIAERDVAFEIDHARLSGANGRADALRYVGLYWCAHDIWLTPPAPIIRAWLHNLRQDVDLAGIAIEELADYLGEKQMSIAQHLATLRLRSDSSLTRILFCIADFETRFGAEIEIPTLRFVAA